MSLLELSPEWCRSFMLLAVILLAVLLVGAVVLRIFADDHPRNGEPPDSASDDEDPELPLAA